MKELASLFSQQAAWLAPARARLLRQARIARRRCVLDLGAGTGAVTNELTRRCAGQVIALDRDFSALTGNPATVRVCADAARLPFHTASFDLVFCQCALLWMNIALTADEVNRVLAPTGVWVALEPDYGGLIEYPPQIDTRPLWLAALTRAGADPITGRKLPGILSRAGFRTKTELLPHLFPADAARFSLLRTLPLTSAERQTLDAIEQLDCTLDPAERVAHLPFFLVLAHK